jgi:hypothetical protein
MTAPIAATAPSTVQFLPAVPPHEASVSASADLLPPPGEIDRGQMQDAMSTLYLIINARAASNMIGTQEQITARLASQKEALKEQLDALLRAIEASGEGSKGFFESMVDLVANVAENLVTLDLAGAVTDPLSDLEDMWNSPRFWQDLQAGAGFIAQTALLVGMVAATAATAGAGGLVVAGLAVALSAGGMVVQETDCLDGMLGDGASDWIGLGMQLSGAAVGYFGAGAAASSWLSTVSAYSHAGGGAATIVTGAATARVAKFEGDALDAEADAKAAGFRSDKMARLVEWLIDGIRETDKSHERAKETLAQAMQTLDQAQLAAVFTSGRQLS